MGHTPTLLVIVNVSMLKVIFLRNLISTMGSWGASGYRSMGLANVNWWIFVRTTGLSAPFCTVFFVECLYRIVSAKFSWTFFFFFCLKGDLLDQAKVQLDLHFFQECRVEKDGLFLVIVSPEKGCFSGFFFFFFCLFCLFLVCFVFFPRMTAAEFRITNGTYTNSSCDRQCFTVESIFLQNLISTMGSWGASGYRSMGLANVNWWNFVRTIGLSAPFCTVFLRGMSIWDCISQV